MPIPRPDDRFSLRCVKHFEEKILRSTELGRTFTAALQAAPRRAMTHCSALARGIWQAFRSKTYWNELY
jgi:hypothetical protein